MSRNEKIKINPEAERRPDSFIKKLIELCDGLNYMSETDSEIFPFEGEKAESVDEAEVLRQTKNKPETPIEERSFPEIFAKLTAIHDFFGEEEKVIAKRFSELQKFLEENLTDLKVYKIGRIRLEVFFVGLDKEKRLMGIRTKAVET